MPIKKIETAAPKGTDAYGWMVYIGSKPMDLQSNLGTKLRLEKGDRFGVRPSGNGKKIRMISEELGPNKVFTLEMDIAQKLNSQSKPVKPAR